MFEISLKSATNSLITLAVLLALFGITVHAEPVQPVSWSELPEGGSLLNVSGNNQAVSPEDGTGEAELSESSGSMVQIGTAKETTGPGIRGQSASGNYAESELIVQFKPGISERDVYKSHAAMGARIIKDFKQRGRPGLQVIRLPPGLTVQEAAERYRYHPFVLFAEPNYIRNISDVTPVIPDDTAFASQWGLHNTGQRGTPDADIDAPEAWASGTGSASVIVAVIDTGVNYNHPDLAGNIFTNPGETGTDADGRDKRSNGIDDDGNGFVDDWHGWDFVGSGDNDPYDGHGHGTHCAGILGAVGNNTRGVSGVSWNISILPLKSLNDQGSGRDSDIIEAFLYAESMGIKITSNSYGDSADNLALEDVIAQSGMLNVFAAGNSGDDSPQYPAYNSSDNIIAVAATDYNDNLASFSNYDQIHVDLAAPGVQIISTYQNAYSYSDGTSMATPFVAGAAALISVKRPDYSPLQIKQVLLNSVDEKPSLQGKILTGGRLNLFEALNQTPDLLDANFTANTTYGFMPQTVQFADVSSGSPTNWSWNFGDGFTSDEQNPVHTYATTGEFDVTLEIQNEEGSSRVSRPGYILIFNGPEKIGVFLDGGWWVDLNGNTKWDENDSVYIFGSPGVTPVIGDWNRDGFDEKGVFLDGGWWVDLNSNILWDENDTVHIFGSPGVTPVIGDWNRDGFDEIGVFLDGGWWVDQNGNYMWDEEDIVYTFGSQGVVPIVQFFS